MNTSAMRARFLRVGTTRPVSNCERKLAERPTCCPSSTRPIERFNRSYRTEVLNAHLFESVAELRALTDTWLRIYNSERPHDSLGRVPPLTFLPRPDTPAESTFEVST